MKSKLPKAVDVIYKKCHRLGVILLTEYHASSIRLPASDIATQ